MFTCFLALVECKKNENIIKPAGVITDVSPKSGQPGTSVTITGSNFSEIPSENEVTFNGIKADVVQATSTQLIVTAPQVTSSGVIELTVNKQKTTGPEFRYYNLYGYGSKNRYAAYWKDGEVTVLTTRGHIRDLAISGNDVYAVGFDATTSVVRAYWKNGVAVSLDSVGPFVEFTGIAVSGSDVYICGKDYAGQGYTVAKYWKNGELVFFTDGSISASATDIAISGDDVYLSGQEYPTAKFWKNGVATPLSDGTFINEANRIRIIGTDVHIIGHEVYGVSSAKVKYWKNGNLTSLKAGDLPGYGLDFAILNSDTYVCGYDHSYQNQVSNNSVAKFWKNGEGTSLSDATTNRYGASIEATDDAVYILTNEFGDIYPYYSVLLKNGTAITPDYGPGVTGSIQGIFVAYY